MVRSTRSADKLGAKGGNGALDGAPAGEPPFTAVLHNKSTGLAHYQPGQRLDPDRVPYPRTNTPLEEAAAIATMLLVFGSAWLAPFVLLAALASLAFGSRLGAAVLAIIVAAAALPPGQRQHWFLHHWVWDTWRRYFRYRGVVPAAPLSTDLNKHLIFVHVPHAVFPMGSWLSFPLCGEPETHVPAPMNGLVATVLLQLPYIKHMFGWMGCYSADKPVMLKLLKTQSVGVIVEGVAGIFHGATQQQERVFIMQRKGFVKVAIQAGADLVPAYHFGSSQMLSVTGTPELSRRLRTSLCFFWGRASLPLPRKHDILSAVGPTVAVTQCDEPTQAQIDETHARFVEVMQATFEQHKHILGPAWVAKKLLVV
ncbi:hypothetical protein WJX81_007274 [Elliptochloris bilobata]|uniref:Acyltransferase n=1 Tax=Elliptochloris bilobata TaxID=381761 RepID=A0AAW1R1R3_9CHLO